MTIYSGNPIIIKGAALEDFLPTPVDFLSESHAMALCFSLAWLVYLLVILKNQASYHQIPSKTSKYSAIALTITMFIITFILESKYTYMLSYKIGNIVKKYVSINFFYNNNWSLLIDFVNYTFYFVLLATIYVSWKSCRGLAINIDRIFHSIISLHKHV
jgi:uncharacterized membrane protein